MATAIICGRGSARGAINPKWTDWRYFSCDNSRNDLVPKLKYSDTSEGVNFSYMYNGCNELTSVPEIDVRKGNDFSYMYRHCSGLETIPDLNTRMGLNFEGMFYADHALVESPALNTTFGIKFAYMYNCCCSMEEIPDLDLRNAEDLRYMFWNCQKMHGNADFYIPKATNLQGMLRNTYNLEDVSFRGWTESRIENTEEIFNSSYALSYVENVPMGKTGAAKMFRGCSKLLQINGFYLNSNVTATDGIWDETFEWCHELADLEMKGVNKWDGLNLKYSKKLSADSFYSVFNTLSDDTIGLTVTFSKEAVDNAFGDSYNESGEAIPGSESEDWSELLATKPNWEIKLS